MSYLLEQDRCRTCGKGAYVGDTSSDPIEGEWCSSCNAPRPGEQMYHALCGEGFALYADFRAHLLCCPVSVSRPDLLPEANTLRVVENEAAKPQVRGGADPNKTGRRGRPSKTRAQLRAADARRHRAKRRGR